MCVCAHMHSYTCTLMRTHTNAWTQKKAKLMDMARASRPAEELQVTAVLSFSSRSPLLPSPCHFLHRAKSCSSRYLIGRGFLLLLSVWLCLFVSYSDSLLESPKVSHNPALYVEVWSFLSDTEEICHYFHLDKQSNVRKMLICYSKYYNMR